MHTYVKYTPLQIGRIKLPLILLVIQALPHRKE